MIAVYAEDLFFFPPNKLDRSIWALLTEFDRHGLLSNLKINYTKSEILPVNVPPGEVY